VRDVMIPLDFPLVNLSPLLRPLTFSCVLYLWTAPHHPLDTFQPYRSRRLKQN
jgi:hypothetical protein